jgi:peroxiredoxin
MVVLLMAIVRRLRVHERLLAELREPSRTIGVGERAPDWIATTVDGERLARTADGGGGTVLAFFAAGCEACLDTMPAFHQVAARARAEGMRVLAVVAGTRESAQPIIAKVDDNVPIVVAPENESTLVRDHRVRSFPSYLAVGSDGIVTATAPTPAMLAAALGLRDADPAAIDA